ncbi:SRPBCC domain-containing protein [Streptomyces sp. NPDC006743]|uniref:SRPBCC domain-containing protein n=1 Tax=Streptomyces sp. NPDC006743 TaxID=3154480 RepID=UPI0034550E23
MEHEVFVPVPARRLRAALADPAQVARAVPGLQQEAGTDPVAGRLKIRVGSHSITYRGTLRVLARDDGGYAVEGEAAESRGTGSVKLALTLRLRDTDEGAALTFGGTASAGGRVAELDPEAVRTAVTRLLNRFAENLAAGAAESAPSLATEDFAPLATGDFEAAPDADDTPAPPPGPAEAQAAPPADAAPPPAPGEQRPADPSEHVSVFDTEIPPSSLDPLADDDAEEKAAGSATEEDGTGTTGQPADLPAEPADLPAEPADLPAEPADLPAEPAPVPAEPADPPAEAAHARRTMIGRSAEEVDHAPPRGRYAPVPAPLTVSAGPTLRWAAPAAALVVASAIVVGRALRRRR